MSDQSPRGRVAGGGTSPPDASAGGAGNMRDAPGGVLVNQGVPEHPWQPGRGVTPEPQVHPSAVVQNTRMWPWTWIGPDSAVSDSEIRDYAYSVSDNQIYNAVVGIDGRYEPYRFHARARHHSSDQAAAVAAAHRVLVTYSPSAQATLDAAYAASLSQIPDGRAKRRGVGFGIRAADHLIAMRAADGRNAPVLFDRSPGPAVWPDIGSPDATTRTVAAWLGRWPGRWARLFASSRRTQKSLGWDFLASSNSAMASSRHGAKPKRAPIPRRRKPAS